MDADILSRLPEVTPDCQEQVIFPDVIKAVCQPMLCNTEESPAQPVDTPFSEDIGSHLSDIKWKEEQSNDKVIARVIDIVKTGSRPTQEEKISENASVQLYLREWNNLIIINDILYRKGMIDGQTVVQLVMPEVFYDIVFSGLHEEVGRQGWDRTMTLFKSRCYWPDMATFVEKWVKECPDVYVEKCQRNQQASSFLYTLIFRWNLSAWIICP